MIVDAVNSPAHRDPRWRLAVAAGALAATAVLPAALAHAGSDAIIWQGDDQSVFLAPQDEETAPPNDHPVTLAPQRIESMLASLRFRYADQESGAPAAVFNEEQIETLGQALATGLTRAQPSQDVTFSIIGAHRLSPGAFARRNRLTAGRVFYRQGKLNLIFGEIQSPYRKKNIYGRIEEDFHPREYGSRGTPAEHESVLVASAAVSLRDDPESARSDWVIVDPDAAARRPTPSPAAADTTPRRANAGDASDVEGRLETLKRLREKELISEDAYRQKVDEILQEL